MESLNNGKLESLRLKRYRERVLSLIRYSLEKSFWVEEKLNYLNDVTNKLDSINFKLDSLQTMVNFCDLVFLFIVISWKLLIFVVISLYLLIFVDIC